MFKKIASVILIFSLCFWYQPSIRASEIYVSAKSAIVVNGETGEIIFSQNARERLPMASTTKIMTAIILIENCDLNEEIVTGKEMVTVEGSSMGLLEGDTVSYRSLLYGMMLPSGNDAATTVAIAIGGSLEGFSLMMNKKAAEIGLDNTNFVTPSGLDAPNHYSTAEDMAKLAVYAMKNSVFRKVVSTKSIALNYGNPPYRRTISGHNKILNLYDGGNGIKTGYTSKAGKCLVSSASKDGKKVIAVSLNDSSTWSNHEKLLDYGMERLIPVKLDWNQEKSLEIISGEKNKAKLKTKSEKIFLTADEIEKLRYEIKIKRFAYAPVSEGQNVGKISYYIGEKFLKSYDIEVLEDVKRIETQEIRFSNQFIKNIIQLVSI